MMRGNSKYEEDRRVPAVSILLHVMEHVEVCLAEQKVK